MICKLCGLRHRTPEEAAEAHAPRPVAPPRPIRRPPVTIVDNNNTPVPDPEPEPRSKAEEKKEPEVVLTKEKKVNYRGREYVGVVTPEGVEITLKNGKKRLVK